MNILVTGGAGYIGSHTCKVLSQRGFCPITVDNLVYGHEWAVKWGPLHKLDLLQTDKLIELIRQEKIKAIIHFAAFAYVGESVQLPLKYYENNLAGTLSLLKAVQVTGVDKLVFSSTCATYGTPQEVPIHEGLKQNPINPYGHTKLMVEKVLRDLAHSQGLRSIALRYFNAAGADPELEIGEDHHPETHLIPLAIQALTNPEKALTVFGENYPTPDGSCVRDYIHVTDLAEAHVLALEHMIQQEKNGAPAQADFFNLGTGSGHSVKEVIQHLSSLAGKPVPHKIGPARPGDPAALVADVKKAAQVLGWRARWSDLNTILRTAYDWHEKHFTGQQK